MTPAVSVLMPVYNTKRYVGQAVESVLAQTFGDFEFIIVDDGSTDGSLKVLQEYAARDSRIRLITRENRGICHSRNEALELARGEFVAIMDSDDICLPRRLEAQIDYLKRNPDCVALGCQVDVMDPDGDRIGRWTLPLHHLDIDAEHLKRNQSIVHPALFARRDAVTSVGGYRENLSEDFDLLLRLAEIGQLANHPDVLLSCRRHGSSATHTKLVELAASTERVVRDAWQRRGLGVPPIHNLGRQTALTAHDNHSTWAWLALRSGNIATARKHAWAAFRRKPLSLSSWKVLYCVCRGY